MLQPFEELGEQVMQAWQTSDFSQGAFPSIAASLLEQSRILHRIGPPEIVDWFMTPNRMPAQDIYEFGQPPIVVYDHEKFYIQVLFWLDSSTCIHEHCFSGAFGVLAGSSVHSSYVFEPETPELDKIRLGRTRFLRSELLSHGDVRAIKNGNGFAHSLFHLEWPSVSVVVRTRNLQQDIPQYNYLKPYLALDPMYIPALPTVQMRMLGSLDRIDRKLFWKHANLLAATCEPWTLFQVVCAAHTHIADGAEWSAFLESASARGEHMLACMVRCAEELLRERKLMSLRATVLNPTHRFLLGLLLNVPDRASLYQLIGERYPGSCQESLMLRWLAEIFDDKSKGIKLTPVSILILQLALHHSDFQHAEDALVARLGPVTAPNGPASGLRRLWNTLREMDILAPLFQPGPGPEHGWEQPHWNSTSTHGHISLAN